MDHFGSLQRRAIVCIFWKFTEQLLHELSIQRWTLIVWSSIQFQDQNDTPGRGFVTFQDRDPAVLINTHPGITASFQFSILHDCEVFISYS